MNETRATRYQRLRRRAAGASWLSAGTVLALVALSPGAAWLAALAHRLAGANDALHAVFALALFCLVLVLIWEAAALPALLYLELGAARRYRASAASAEEAVAALLPAAVVAVLAAFVAGLLLQLAVAVAGAWWWAATGVLASAVLALALHLAPVVMMRLVQVRPLARPALKAHLDALVSRAGVPVAGILEWRVDADAPITAVVAGTGRSRRVFVASPLLRDWTDDEIAVVVAHELAHHRHQDLWRTWLLHVGLVWMALCVADLAWRFARPASVGISPAALESLPFIGLVVGLVWVLTGPLRHAQSRRHEQRADIFALAMTDRADAFRAAIRRLGEQHLAEERPSATTRWLHYRHPSVAERLALAESYLRVRGVVGTTSG